ncbi:MAG TPA: methylated-DNA--[protein]-cysteine S-methyltransferase [Xanthobacteraceae bacterium]|jgi:methylated-DNA-[protein]-cysteine S-methyltransferase
MPSIHFATFDTAIGPCGIAWGERGVVGVQLPGKDKAATRARLRRRHPGAAESEPPLSVRQAIDEIVALLRGERRDLCAIRLDMEHVQPFERRVYELARAIPPGQITTYGELAKRLGDPSAAQAVGAAMGRNPFPIVVPCHRVVGAGTRLGGFSAPGGVKTKRRMLAIEGSPAAGTPDLFEMN